MRFILWLSTTDMIQLIVLSVGGILLTNNIFYEKILYPLFVTYIISHFSPRNKPNKKKTGGYASQNTALYLFVSKYGNIVPSLNSNSSLFSKTVICSTVPQNNPSSNSCRTQLLPNVDINALQRLHLFVSSVFSRLIRVYSSSAF